MSIRYEDIIVKGKDSRKQTRLLIESLPLTDTSKEIALNALNAIYYDNQHNINTLLHPDNDFRKKITISLEEANREYFNDTIREYPFSEINLVLSKNPADIFTCGDHRSTNSCVRSQNSYHGFWIGLLNYCLATGAYLAQIVWPRTLKAAEYSSFTSVIPKGRMFCLITKNPRNFVWLSRAFANTAFEYGYGFCQEVSRTSNTKLMHGWENLIGAALQGGGEDFKLNTNLFFASHEIIRDVRITAFKDSTFPVLYYKNGIPLSTFYDAIWIKKTGNTRQEKFLLAGKHTVVHENVPDNLFMMPLHSCESNNRGSFYFRHNGWDSVPVLDSNEVVRFKEDLALRRSASAGSERWSGISPTDVINRGGLPESPTVKLPSSDSLPPNRHLRDFNSNLSKSVLYEFLFGNIAIGKKILQEYHNTEHCIFCRVPRHSFFQYNNVSSTSVPGICNDCLKRHLKDCSCCGNATLLLEEIPQEVLALLPTWYGKLPSPAGRAYIYIPNRPGQIPVPDVIARSRSTSSSKSKVLELLKQHDLPFVSGVQLRMLLHLIAKNKYAELGNDSNNVFCTDCLKQKLEDKTLQVCLVCNCSILARDAKLHTYNNGEYHCPICGGILSCHACKEKIFNLIAPYREFVCEEFRQVLQESLQQDKDKFHTMIRRITHPPVNRPPRELCNYKEVTVYIDSLLTFIDKHSKLFAKSKKVGIQTANNIAYCGSCWENYLRGLKKEALKHAAKKR